MKRKLVPLLILITCLIFSQIPTTRAQHQTFQTLTIGSVKTCGGCKINIGGADYTNNQYAALAPGTYVTTAHAAAGLTFLGWNAINLTISSNTTNPTNVTVLAGKNSLLQAFFMLPPVEAAPPVAFYQLAIVGIIAVVAIVIVVIWKQKPKAPITVQMRNRCVFRHVEQ